MSTSRFDVPLASLTRVRELHHRVDESASRIAAALGDRLRCGHGCSACCVDDLTVTVAEAARIAHEHLAVLEGAPGPEGACAMLDAAGGCRVYSARPYVCRTQGLPLRWLDLDDAGVPVEHRDICPKNDAPAEAGERRALEALPVESCWTLGRVEQVLAAIARLADPSSDAPPPARIALRALFGRGFRKR